MPFIDADRVRETTTTTGTGAVSLGGAISGTRTFASVMANGDVCHYVIAGATEWEVGLGTYNTSGNTLSRTQVFSSSSGGSAVSLSAGTKQVFIAFAANRVALDRDIGTSPNQIPLAGQLGSLAFVDAVTLPVAAGAGITSGTGTVHGANVTSEAGVKVVRILVDLTGLASSAAGDIIGVGASAAFIGQLPSMTFLGARMLCLETPAGGETDIDLYSATEGTGVYDGAITGLTETLVINAGAQTAGTASTSTADATSAAYLYLVSVGATAGTYTAGRFLIEVFGV